jgi:hypothetical protein
MAIGCLLEASPATRQLPARPGLRKPVCRYNELSVEGERAKREAVRLKRRISVCLADPTRLAAHIARTLMEIEYEQRPTRARAEPVLLL